MTLIETVIVVAIIGILVATALPSFARFLSNSRAAGVTNDFIHAIALTRGEALRRNQRVYLAPVGTRWHDGWVVFVDRNDDRVFDAASDEAIARHDALGPTIAMTNPINSRREPFTDVGSPQRTYVMFDGSGFARQRNGGLLLGSMVIRDTSGDAQTVRTVCLALGRVRVVNDHAGCA